MRTGEFTLASMTSPRCVAIILAGGVGNRFSAKGPKQFFFLNGKPILYHSLKPFTELPEKRIAGIIVVAPLAYMKETESVIKRYFQDDVRIHIIAGGKYRINSYFNAIDTVSKKYKDIPIGIVHDASRPLVSSEDIEHLYKVFVRRKADALLVGRSLPESLFRKQPGGYIECISRDDFLLGQSPNFFTLALLREIRSSYSISRTKHPETLDILEIAAAMGHLRVVSEPLPHSNMKVTYPHDIEIAATLLARIKPGDFS